ncbi:hypothetical protein D9C73_023742 [Collichthys lucidus]|uniref:Uncharacterized protein n=1 Tax=Collichthys lucidus TaxID=240159 RepID=A0A4U5VMA5_COLLU|nr:hypothetical protein D9C73_023742 [Collichthys lucidus]
MKRKTKKKATKKKMIQSRKDEDEDVKDEEDNEEEDLRDSDEKKTIQVLDSVRELGSWALLDLRDASSLELTRMCNLKERSGSL